ncbi:hypothetical protein [Modestobacter sp. NPDC049651]|uniref:hypothetical protein n=1 Tax=unclassified Modestobacter TaxID=2643866 RepID=UPI0033F7110E
MTHASRPIVASGKPCAVTVLPDGGPPSLDSFLGDAEFTVDGAPGPVVVRGHGVPLGEEVRFHEKDVTGGKDVRVWHVRRDGDGFSAVHVAAF